NPPGRIAIVWGHGRGSGAPAALPEPWVYCRSISSRSIVNSLSQAQRRLIWIGCLVPFVSSIVLMLWYWPGSLPQDSTSGVWTALAQDFANGILYRPTADAYGFGGTRYMPLFFVLHGTLIRLSVDPIVAGLLLTIASIVLFDLPLLSCLRALEVPWSLAVPRSARRRSRSSRGRATAGPSRRSAPWRAAARVPATRSARRSGSCWWRCRIRCS